MPAWSATVPAESLSGEMVRKMSEAVKELEERYNEIVKGVAWESLSFDQKKPVTSALRRMLPQGLSTSIIFTANHRTLRWLIGMRTSPGAEFEIRKIFGQIGDICLRDYPLIYKDFEKTKLEDGTAQYKAKLRSKV